MSVQRLLEMADDDDREAPLIAVVAALVDLGLVTLAVDRPAWELTALGEQVLAEQEAAVSTKH